MTPAIYSLERLQTHLVLQIDILTNCAVILNNLNRLKAPINRAEKRIVQSGFVTHLMVVYANALVTDLDKVYSRSASQQQSFVHMFKHLREDDYDSALLEAIRQGDLQDKEWSTVEDVRQGAKEFEDFFLSKDDTMKRLKHHRDKYSGHRDTGWKPDNLLSMGELNALTSTAISIHGCITKNILLVEPAHDEVKKQLSIEEMLTAWSKSIE